MKSITRKTPPEPVSGADFNGNSEFSRLVDEVLNAPRGERHRTLRTKALRAWFIGVPDDEIRSAFRAASEQRASLFGIWFDLEDTHATIEGAIRYGRRVGRRRTKWNAGPQEERGAAPAVPWAPSASRNGTVSVSQSVSPKPLPTLHKGASAKLGAPNSHLCPDAP